MAPSPSIQGARAASRSAVLRVPPRPAAESDAARAEYFADATDDSSRAIEWTMPKGRFVDAFPMLVMTTSGLRGSAAAHSSGTWDVRRFRPNHGGEAGMWSQAAQPGVISEGDSVQLQ